MARKKPDKNVLVAIGRRVAQARASKGWKQEDLAHAARVTTGTVSRIELGKQTPTMDVIGGLCDVLGRTADWILFEKEDRRPFAGLGAELRRARELKGYTLPRLAAAIGPPHTSEQIERWEVGLDRPTDPQLGQLAAILGRDQEQIISDACSSNSGGQSDVTNEDVRLMLDANGVRGDDERYEFARFVAKWKLDTRRALAVLKAAGAAEASGSARKPAKKPVRAAR